MRWSYTYTADDYVAVGYLRLEGVHLRNEVLMVSHNDGAVETYDHADTPLPDDVPKRFPNPESVEFFFRRRQGWDLSKDPE